MWLQLLERLLYPSRGTAVQLRSKIKMNDPFMNWAGLMTRLSVVYHETDEERVIGHRTSLGTGRV